MQVEITRIVHHTVNSKLIAAVEKTPELNTVLRKPQFLGVVFAKTVLKLLANSSHLNM